MNPSTNDFENSASKFTPTEPWQGLGGEINLSDFLRPISLRKNDFKVRNFQEGISEAFKLNFRERWKDQVKIVGAGACNIW